MAIPTIAPYSLPTREELPPPAVPWRPERERTALLIHDMQRYFLSAFPAGSPPVTAVLDNIATLRTIAREAAIPIVYTAQPGSQSPADRSLLIDFWGEGLADVPEQTEIVSELAPADGEVVLTKWRYSAFQRTDLRDRLHAAGRDQLLICGVYAHIGCQVTACEAFQRDVQPFLIADAVADFSRADHDRALDWVASRCGRVLCTRDVARQLESGRANPRPSATARSV